MYMITLGATKKWTLSIICRKSVNIGIAHFVKVCYLSIWGFEYYVLLH